MPRPATRAEFEAAIADSAASPAFYEQYERYAGFGHLMEAESVIHDGNLRIRNSWRTPGLCTLINGHLEVENVLDLQSRFDQGGLFIVIGNVTCRHLIGEHGLTCFVDGDLTARETLITGYGDSALSVVGTLRTKLFIGCDIWASVGAGAEIEYGVGHCVPAGELGAAPIAPRHSERATARIVTPQPRSKGWLFEPDQFAELIREGKPVFR